jgi:phage shock protein PspC (stress-responsive transcriptional regulator)
MYCSHCGKPLDATARFCPACGAATQPFAYQQPPVATAVRGQITRPRYNRLVAGICAGLALHYGWDLSLVRVICALLIVFTGVGLIAYLIAWIVIPEEPFILPENSTTGTTI